MPRKHPNKATTSENALQVAYDDQTGKQFDLVHENWFAIVVASVSAVYLIGALGFLLWLLFDTWTGRYLILQRLGYDTAILTSGSFRLMAFVAIGGALGGAVDGIRSLVSWHLERQAYGPRFIWKDLSLPLTGAAVAMIAYVTVRGGVGVFDGDFSLDQKGSAPAMTAFAIAAVAGFSSHQVFKWLDAQGDKVFRVATGTRALVPDLVGKTLAEAKATLREWKLTIGGTTQEGSAEANDDTVLRQSPAPGSEVSGGDAVDVTIGAKSARTVRFAEARVEE